jgi:hypothetical protein
MEKQEIPAAEDPTPAQPAPSPVIPDQSQKNVPVSFRPENSDIRRLVEQTAAECPGPDGKPNNSKAVNALLAELLEARNKLASLDELSAENKHLKVLVQSHETKKPVIPPAPLPQVATHIEPTPGVLKFLMNKLQNYGYFGTRSYLEKTIREIPA